MKIAFVGIGNPLKGDDGAGPEVISKIKYKVENCTQKRVGKSASGRLMPCLITSGHKSPDYPTVHRPLSTVNLLFFDCGTVPENYLGKIIKESPDVLIFVDAGIFNAPPGTIKLLNLNNIDTNSISTHSLSLDYIINWIKTEIKTQVFVIGIQAKSTNFGDPISREVKESIKLLSSNKIGAEIKLKGLVQGVGMRPYLHKLSNKFSLKGRAKNFPGGVKLWVEGNLIDVLLFFDTLGEKDALPLANIVEKELFFKPPKSFKDFKIETSDETGTDFVLIPPDIAICDECLKELQNPKDRRHNYPFINCINCGPRFTIIKNIPYDRKNTTMQKFTMCPNCENEYANIKNRRYHAQPNACYVCGPDVEMSKKSGNKALTETINLLTKGEIVALKGIGGFHLICDATNDSAVNRLRKLKSRPFKPFAVMCSSIDKVKQFAEVSKSEEELLTSNKAPIVLLKKKKSSKIAKSIAPDNNYIGVMLAYTPLHYLISNKFLCIIATSGNTTDEPLIKDNNEAKTKLSKFTKHFLLHNRPIEVRCDDSLVKFISDKPVLFRRARGYTPLPVKLPCSSSSILAVGAELKNTFCITRENFAFLSQHIGDLKNYENYEVFTSTIEHFKKLFKIRPDVIAYDLHPEYLSTKYALELSGKGITKIGIQHHWAHIVSCMAENNIDSQVIGVAFDGTGYGTDGNIWGGEFLLCTYTDFERIMHFKYVGLPGGDIASVETGRMAISYLFDMYGSGNGDKCKKLISKWKNSNLIYKMLENKFNCPISSSVGRIFDAVAAITGVCQLNTCEGESAMKLEKLAEEHMNCRNIACDVPEPYTYTIKEDTRS
ncbi:MAG: carbamoyltransferase HypF, partial [bacterium]|nr:carbamoyltransferase HypF [bacterium]